MKLWQRRALGLLALGGSYLGLSLGVEQIFTIDGLFGKALMAPFLVLYGWGIWCGIAMIEGSSDSILLNRRFWAFQIPIVSSPIVSYMFASGALLNVSLQPLDSKFSFNVRFGSQFGCSVMQGEPWALGVNIFAACICLYLTWCLRRETHGEAGDMGRGC